MRNRIKWSAPLCTEMVTIWLYCDVEFVQVLNNNLFLLQTTAKFSSRLGFVVAQFVQHTYTQQIRAEHSHQNCCLAYAFSSAIYVDTWNDEKHRWKMKFVEIARALRTCALNWVKESNRLYTFFSSSIYATEMIKRSHSRLQSALTAMTIRLIEQNLKWFISFGLLNWNYVCRTAFWSFFFFLIIIKSAVSLCASRRLVSAFDTAKWQFISVTTNGIGNSRNDHFVIMCARNAANLAYDRAYFFRSRISECCVCLEPRNRFH